MIPVQPIPSLSVSQPPNPHELDYTSPFLCKVDLASLRPPIATSSASGFSNINMSGINTNAAEEGSVIDVGGEVSALKYMYMCPDVIKV